VIPGSIPNLAAERPAEALVASLTNVDNWVENHRYKGYEPFDGLSSFLRPLTFGNVFLNRLLQQVVRQSPLNLRPLLGVKPQESTIGRAYMAWGYLSMLKSTRDTRFEDKARRCLDWLIDNRSPGYAEYGWGKHFDCASRGGSYARLEPITVWTSLIGLAFLEGYETLGEQRYLAVALSACRWVCGIARLETEEGTCLSYTASGPATSIHNHGMLAAAMLARTAKHAPDRSFLTLARNVMRFSCSRQLPNGGWYYGEEPKHHWIDNFHTGYNLDSLKCYTESSGNTEFSESMQRGFEFYVSHFFEPSGRPRYYHDRTYPVDSQCVSQSIDTLANFADREPTALSLAVKVAEWAIATMQDPDGSFYYRLYPTMKAKTPMLHWGQATMYKSLALLTAKLRAAPVDRVDFRPAGMNGARAG
jgi:hypothetical protein